MNAIEKPDFDLLDAQLLALIESEHDKLACSALFVALIYQALPDINWLGLYVIRNRELVLGPFQGNTACVRIALGQGVCGSAAAQMKTLRVNDVHKFDGHIACDVASNSELVVPIVQAGEVVGVLDIDSPRRGRFSNRDQEGIEKLCRTFEKHVIEKTAAGNADPKEFI